MKKYKSKKKNVIHSKKKKDTHSKKKKRLTQKKYDKFLTKQRLTAKETKELNNELFERYCSCKKSVRSSKNYKPPSEYPICIQSIYKNRGIVPPQNVSNLPCP